MSAPEALIAAREAGLDGLVLTEHNKRWPEEDLAALSREFKLTVLGGMEVTTTAGDVLVFGPCEEFVAPPTPQELVRAAPGAFLVAAHPFRGFLLFGFGGLEVSEAASRPLFDLVHGVEVANCRAGGQENELAAQVADRLGLVKIGGSDAHTTAEVGLSRSVFNGPVETTAQLVVHLQSGRVRVEKRDA